MNNAHAIILIELELFVTVLTCGTKNWVPLVELRGANCIEKSKIHAAEPVGGCLPVVAEGGDAALRGARGRDGSTGAEGNGGCRGYNAAYG